MPIVKGSKVLSSVSFDPDVYKYLDELARDRDIRTISGAINHTVRLAMSEKSANLTSTNTTPSGKAAD